MSIKGEGARVRDRSTYQNQFDAVVVYSRVSTDAQERDGTSLDTQRRACLEHAKGLQVVQNVRDTASGFSLDRPGSERIRQLLNQGAVDVVVAYVVERLSHNQIHIGILFDEAEQAGARLEFVTENFEDNAIGRFILAARDFVGELGGRSPSEPCGGRRSGLDRERFPREQGKVATGIHTIPVPGAGG